MPFPIVCTANCGGAVPVDERLVVGTQSVMTPSAEGAGTAALGLWLFASDAVRKVERAS
jgi:hypothetical protein